MVSPLSDAPATLRRAAARPEAVVAGPTYRFTVLTSRLIRVEHSDSGEFTDAATQLVVDRDLGPVPDFQVVRGEDRVEVVTEHLHLTHVPSLGFTRTGLNVRLRTASLAPHGGTWYHGDVWDPTETFPTNLGGTARTLDEADGAVPLSPGLLAVNGITALDDSASLLLTEDEWVVPRPAHPAAPSSTAGSGPDQDLYVLGYAQDYRSALADFFRLTGPSPLVPRALLGNWWSRYHAYTAQEYLALMDRFTAEHLPFSVAVIDMDWHLTDVDPAIGPGWTGYTWNRDLIPDPAAFLGALHDRGMLTALNVHPALGIRRHEEVYPDVCRALGIDPASGADVPFDVGDRDFVSAYLTQVHHPMEAQGVDFWWLDWQQGGTTTVPGLDPLWMLNHIHYLDSGRERPVADDGAPGASSTGGAGSGTVERRRPVTFSRFADASSHRTPVGFSGDTVTTWDSLAFQPEFTATAANIGYYWWSNDIGGHMFGVRDDAMAARWVQLGCFSPINRLHSTQSVFNSKEPWRYSRDARATMDAHLRLRHRLVPWLYTWARRSTTDGVGPVRPLYQDHPTRLGAYAHRTTFLFGDLVVVPMVHPLDPVTGLGQETAWLPDGVWYDLPTARRYDARVGGEGRTLTLSRSLDRLPVLARAGSVLPLAGDLTEAAGDNPHDLLVVVVPGADGSFTLEEDDASPAPGPDAVARTRFALTWPRGEGGQDAEGLPEAPDQAVLTVRLEGAAEVVPEARRLRVRVLGGTCSSALVRPAGGPDREVPVARVTADGFTLGGGVEADLGELGREELVAGVELVLSDAAEAPASWREELYGLLEPAQLPYAAKDQAWAAVDRGLEGPALVAELEALGLPEALRSAVLELL